METTQINKNYKKGFGLLEVLISIIIIVLILTSLVLIGRKALSNSLYLQQRAQAIYLAQEGIELIRQTRDTNWIDGNDQTQWNTLLTSGASSGQGKQYKLVFVDDLKRYLLERLEGTGGDNAAGEKIEFSEQGDNGKIKETVFYRTVTASTIEGEEGSILIGDGENDIVPNKNAIKVTVIVKWQFDGLVKTTSVSEILTNWRPNF